MTPPISIGSTKTSSASHRCATCNGCGKRPWKALADEPERTALQPATLEELGQKAETRVQESRARHVSGRHKSSQEKWRSEVLAANCRNTSGSETHFIRARLLSLWERHSAGLRAASSLFAGLLAEET